MRHPPRAPQGPAGPMEVRRILVGARGVLGRELIRRYRARGIETVAAFAAADADTPYVEEADYDAFLGDGSAGEPWSAPSRMVELAMDAGCDALHPGRGPASGALDLYAAAAAANVLVVGLDPRRAAEALDQARMLARVRASGLAVPPAEAVADGDRLEAAARIGVPLRARPAHGGRERAVDTFDALASVPEGPVVLVHEVPGRDTLDVVLFGDRDGVVPLGVVATSGPVAIYPAERGEELVGPAVGIAQELGVIGVATVRFRVAADGSVWWWAFRPQLPPAAALIEAVQGIDLLQAQLAAASGQRLGWSTPDAAAVGRHGAAAWVSRTGPGVVAGVSLPSGEGVGATAAVARGSVLPVDAEPVLVEVTSVAERGEGARRGLLEALRALEVDGLPTDLAEVAGAVARSAG